MSLPRYENYKDSGVEWIGEIPEGWRVVQIRRIFEICKRIVGEDGFDVLSITQKGIRIKDTESGDGQLSADYSKYQLVEVGNFAMNHMDLLTGYVDISPYYGVTSPDYRVFRLKDKFSEPRYYLYLFQNAYKRKIFFPFGQGSSHLGRWRLPTDEFNAFQLPVPPSAVQQAIATFLDHETGKIDALVSEQEKLIGLLKEKRQAVISHAVTKGLDPDAKMKDSGIGWLGEVPEGWGIKRIKHLLILLTDYTANGSFASLAENVKYLSEGHSRLVRLTDLRENLENDGIYVDEKAHNYLRKSELFGGEILIANVGAYAGYGCMMPFGKGTATLGPNMYLMKFDKNLTSNDFVLTCLNSDYLKEQLKLAATSTAQPKLNKDNVKECFILLPPKSEQEKIQIYINQEISKIDTLIEETQKVIELMKERRMSLISAAVTGKIDVREYADVSAKEAV